MKGSENMIQDLKFVAIENNMNLKCMVKEQGFDGAKIYPIYTSNIPQIRRKFPNVHLETYLECSEEKVELSDIQEKMDKHNMLICNLKDYVFLCLNEDENISDILFVTYLYARLTNKKVRAYHNKKQLQDILSTENIKSMMLITSMETFDFKEYFDLSEKHEKVAKGCILYTDKYFLNFYLAKLILHSTASVHRTHIMINRISSPKASMEERINSEEQFCYLPKPYCTYDNLKKSIFSEKAVLEFNYLSHSRECALFFNDFYLCGLQSCKEYINTNTALDKYKHYPCCYYDEKDCNITNRSKINAEMLNADIMFLNGCNLGDLNRSFVPLNYTVVANLINNNAVSVITSPTIKVGNIAENVLAYNLLKYGYSEGEKLYYINKFLDYSHIEDKCYFLIGDPCLIGSGHQYRKLGDIKVKKEIVDNNSYYLDIEAAKGETLIEISLGEGWDKPYISGIDFYNSNESISIEDLYYCIVEDIYSDNKSLMLFSSKSFDFERVRITLTFRDYFQDKIEKITEYMRDIPFYKDNFVMSNNLKGNMENLQNSIKNIYPLYKTCRFDLQAIDKLSKLLIKIEKKLSMVLEDIFKSIADYTLFKQDNYYERICEKRIPLQANRISIQCMNCKCKEHIYPYKILTIEREYFRYSSKCMHCGLIRDIPDDKLVFESYGSMKFGSEGTECEITKIINKHECNVPINIACICIDTSDIVVEPAIVKTLLKPGEEYTLKVKLTPKTGLKKHFYLFSFYVMAGSKFYYYSKMFGYK